jgi:hypothetical protein
MSTAEMSMTTNTARALIDARLEAVERALFGRMSRAERLDIVGEVESRIDELLRESCSPGAEPSRDDVLAVLSRLDPPEAYLDFESGEAFRQPSFERIMSRPRLETANLDDKLRRRSMVGGICGIVGLFAAFLAPAFYLLAQALESFIVLFLGIGGCLVICLVAGTASLVLSGLGQLRTGWSIAGLVLGVISVLLSMIGILFGMFLLMG